ncbi:MAG: DnaJ domain-containing protein [Cyanobacteria bacterium P01_H01_bin.119]
MPQASLTNHYQTLEVAETASQSEIKQAYRRLAKKFHPDSEASTSSAAQNGHNQIVAINAAYEVLGDPQNRSRYDHERRLMAAVEALGGGSDRDRNQRTVESQNLYRQRRQQQRQADTHIHEWLKRVYRPTDRLMGQILSPLKGELRSLAADPFDDELMEGFQTYLETSRTQLEKAKSLFKSMATPSNAAGVAMDLYHCLNQLEDGIDEMERFTCSYQESYLHTGQELFRLVTKLRKGMKEEIKATL